jgi:NAD(P)-dependent dehydrogenase (short-subunit alcohol dehydrogenase family)
MQFAGKTVVVTGGTGALGAAVVEAIVREGGRCVVPAHLSKENPAVAGPGFVEVVSGIDLTDEDAVAGFYQKAGAVWASIHTAGGFAMAPIAQTTKADFQKMLDTNALTAFLCCREAAKAIRRTGAGRIVNVAAKAGLHPPAKMAAYAASKAAVIALTQSLAEELAPEGIWVNAVLPSIMDTPQNRASFPAGTDYSKWPSVADVAATIQFLASPENKVTRGALVPVYGKS